MRLRELAQQLKFQLAAVIELPSDDDDRTSTVNGQLTEEDITKATNRLSSIISLLDELESICCV